MRGWIEINFPENEVGSGRDMSSSKSGCPGRWQQASRAKHRVSCRRKDIRAGLRGRGRTAGNIRGSRLQSEHDSFNRPRMRAAIEALITRRGLDGGAEHDPRHADGEGPDTGAVAEPSYTKAYISMLEEDLRTSLRRAIGAGRATARS